MAVTLNKIEFKDGRENPVKAEQFNQMQANTQTAINTLDTNIESNKTALEGKQNTLKAGTNITIAADGTISASGGTAETITNSNGTAIKFPDGTMICYKTVSFSDVAFDKPQGNLYFCAALSFGNTPETFISKPVAFMNISNGWGLQAGVRNYSTTSFGNTQLFRGDSTTQSSITIELFAIGKWKNQE